MEGRTIVRPDPVSGDIGSPLARNLQWRAGQSSGQTRQTRPTYARCLASFNGGPDNRPARHSTLVTLATLRLFLQWRAGQSSGQTYALGDGKGAGCDLQWRAGQSSGQTCGSWFHVDHIVDLQWRAGQSSGQTTQPSEDGSHALYPSMEGRTIVRPDLAWTARRLRRRLDLQWRAGQSSGQT